MTTTKHQQRFPSPPTQHEAASRRLANAVSGLDELTAALRGAKRLARHRDHRLELENLARIATGLGALAAEVAAKLGGARHG